MTQTEKTQTETTQTETTRAADAVEAVVRDSYGRMLAYLASTTRDIADAEDAFSDALAAALRTWPERGVPRRPDSWLITVARRNIIGAARRRDVAARALPDMERLSTIGGDETVRNVDAIPDRRLQLMFACAHPAIDPAVRSPLILQATLGLDAARIAAAFLVPPATMGQRLVRAKSKIRDAAIPFAIPPAAELPHRLHAVLGAIYAAYGSGYDDPTGADHKRRDLTSEAVRLARLTAGLLHTEPETHGLLALVLHVEARSAARRGPDGRFVPLAEQDMTLWSAAKISEAEHHLAIAFGRGRPGPYQLQAAIQSVHNRRALVGHTDWRAIAALYDGLVHHEPTIGAHVARAAAWAEAAGPTQALELLDALPPERVRRYQPYHAVRADSLQRTGDHAGSRVSASHAIELTEDVDVKAYLNHRYLAPSC